MPTIEELTGTGPGSIDEVIKIAPDGVPLNPDKTQGRKHRQLLKDMLQAMQELGWTEEQLKGLFLPLANPEGETVAYGTDGALSLYENGFDWEDYDANGGYYLNGETNAYIPTRGFFGSIVRLIALRGTSQAGVFAYHGEAGAGVMFRVGEAESVQTFDFRQDGKLYINGVEFTGAGSTYTPPIPYTRTTQTGTTLIYNQSKVQERVLTANLTISTITNPVLGESILLEVDGRGNVFTFGFSVTGVEVLNGTSFIVGKQNKIYLNCIQTTPSVRFDCTYSVVV